MTGIRPAARRATTAHAARIAVWDMDNVFPALERTLQAMNLAQTSFGFELADLSVPLDVWDLEESKDTPYLSAERLAHRLQSSPMELGVEVLSCVTRHWMRSGDWLNLYAWWPAGGKPPIIVFSVAGFERLAPKGRKRTAIANAMVAGLAGFYGDVDSHQRGGKDCPLAPGTSRFSWAFRSSIRAAVTS